MHLGVLQKKVILSVNSRVIFPDVVSELIIGRNFFYFTQHNGFICGKNLFNLPKFMHVFGLENFNFENDFSMGYSGGPKIRKITKFLVLGIRSHLTVYSSHFWSLIVTKYFRRNYPEHCAHDRLGEILKTF